MSRSGTGVFVGVVGWLALAAGLSGCAGGGGGDARAQADESRLAANGAGETSAAGEEGPDGSDMNLEAYAERASKNVLDALAMREGAGGGGVGGPGAAARAPADDVAGAAGGSTVTVTRTPEAAKDAGKDAGKEQGGKAEADAPPEPSMDERTREAARWLEAATLAELGGGVPAGRAAARLAALAAFGIDAIDGVLEGEAGAYLSPEEREAARAVARILSGEGDGGSLAEALLAGATEVSRAMPMRIATVALCRSVEGFGQYRPLPGSSLLAGRSHPMIVYSEIEHFGHRARRRGEGRGGTWAVEVSQELNLYHDDGTLAWREGEQVLVDTSNRRRRDFYLIQQIELPPTLTVGSYDLKVIVRDRTTGAVDEALVPIEVVADPGLASR